MIAALERISLEADGFDTGLGGDVGICGAGQQDLHNEFAAQQIHRTEGGVQRHLAGAGQWIVGLQKSLRNPAIAVKAGSVQVEVVAEPR